MSSPTTSSTPIRPGKKAQTIVNNMKTSKGISKDVDGSFPNIEGNDFFDNGDQ
jgi:hypothetical protein